jgi:hypothetical protein
MVQSPAIMTLVKRWGRAVILGRYIVTEVIEHEKE